MGRMGASSATTAIRRPLVTAPLGRSGTMAIPSPASTMRVHQLEQKKAG
jgi:hypothetical protein